VNNIGNNLVKSRGVLPNQTPLWLNILGMPDTRVPPGSAPTLYSIYILIFTQTQVFYRNRD